MSNNSKFVVDIINKDTSEERVVIKFNNALTDTARVHKSTAFLEKHPKTVSKNFKIATKITNFLNYIQDKVNNGEIKSIEFMTIEDGTKYFESIKDSLSHTELEAQKRLLTTFYYFSFKNNSLRKITKADFSYDKKAGKNVLKILF